MIKSFAASTVVVSRCGMSTLTEISYLAKPAILIPMPKTHQEKNAEVFAKAEAAIILDQIKLNSDIFIKNIRELINNDVLRQNLSNNVGQVIKSDVR